MNPREFSAALAGMDRSKWPVQPAAAENAIFDYYRLADDEEDMRFIWVDSPNDIKKHHQKPQSRPHRGFSMQEAIQSFNKWRWPGPPNDDFWVTNDDEATEEIWLPGDYPYLPRESYADGLGLLLDAYMAGALAVIEYTSAAYVVSRPVMRVDDRGRLHHETKPAIAWFEGPYGYRIHGVEVEEHIVTDRRKITMEDIYDIDNMEARRVVIERFGWKKFLRQLGADKVDEDPVNGVLWSATAPRGDEDFGREMRLLELKDPSTDRRYFIRVPPGRTTALSARAWTFNRTVEEFQRDLVKET